MLDIGIRVPCTVVDPYQSKSLSNLPVKWQKEVPVVIRGYHIHKAIAYGEMSNIYSRSPLAFIQAPSGIHHCLRNALEEMLCSFRLGSHIHEYIRPTKTICVIQYTLPVNESLYPAILFCDPLNLLHQIIEEGVGIEIWGFQFIYLIRC
jgi:hypothetical protein